MKIFLSFLIFVLSFVACSDDSSESYSGEIFHYDSSLNYDEQTLSLDSITNCIIDRAETEYHASIDTVFISSDGKKARFTFPSYLLCSKDNVKSIGVYAIKDTLKIELIENEKTPVVSLDCPVWVYSTLNEDVNAKYILTRSGVYPLGMK